MPHQAAGQAPVSSRDLALAMLEQAINRLLDLDPYTARRLARFHGRVIAIEIVGIGVTLYFIPGHDGHLQILGQIDGEPDCRLSGTPLDLMRSGDSRQGAAQLFAGRVTISGDTELAHRFGEALAGLDIDWEEQLAELVGDVAAHEVGLGIRKASRWARQSSQLLGQDLGEYLTEEARLLPTRYETDEFLHQVDALRDDAERLAARVQRLERRLLDLDKEETA